MTTIIVTAHACKFEDRCMSYSPFDKPLARDSAQIKTCEDIDRVLADMADRVKTSYAGSFFVSEMLVRGERAPSGYRQRKFRHDVHGRKDAHPQIGDPSPWGVIQHVERMGQEATSVSTASHGGIWVTAEALERIPEAFRVTAFSPGAWFEEDADWVIPYLVLDLAKQQGGTEEAQRNGFALALECCRRSHPELHKLMTGQGDRRFRVVTWDDGRMAAQEAASEAELFGLGYAATHRHFGRQTRPELQGAPILQGLAGPMWDGDAIRYEDSRCADILSR